MSDPRVYIIIVNYKNWQDSRDCLESLLRSTYTKYSVFIIDNDSRNNSLEHLREWLQNSYRYIKSSLLKRPETDQLETVSGLPEVVFFQNDKNEGFAAGNNLVLRFLQHEDAYIWLLNPDMLVRANTLAELTSFALQQPAECIIGAEVRYHAGNQGLFFYGGGKVNFASATIQLVRTKEGESALDYISGGCLFTHAGNIRRLGLLPGEYFLYWEETDWCFRAQQQGYRLLVCPSGICYDKVSTVIGKGFMSDYYYARNGLLFISKYRKKNIPVVLMFMAMRFLKRVVTGQWERARGVYKGAKDFLKKQY
ncbi:MAG: glycosyltransferase family 2 protein [Chitinophagaceae bacterium]|nr:glycosyltransferase family 2 protein [Chitinophagaceae bacterium]